MSQVEADVRTTLNVPFSIETKRGPVLVREMSVIDGMVAIDRVVAFAVELAQMARQGSERTGVMLELFRKNPTLILSIVSPSTDRDVEFLSTLSLAEFLQVVEAFLDANGDLIDRFFSLLAKAQEIGARWQKGTGTSRGSSPISSAEAGPTPTSAG